MDPVLIDVPKEIETRRMLLRVPQTGDGREINAAVVESAVELAQWMPWANPTPDVDNSESWVRKAASNFLAREQLNWKMLLKDGERYIGSIGFPRLNWTVPRFEIGYWLRTSMVGHGFMTEAVQAIEQLAFDRLNARRVEIQMDDRNTRSWRVAERATFQLEGILRNDCRTADGRLRDTRIYAKTRPDGASAG